MSMCVWNEKLSARDGKETRFHYVDVTYVYRELVASST